MKILTTIAIVVIAICLMGSYQSQKEYHQRRVLHYHKKVTDAQKKINYHTERVFYYQKMENKENSKK